MDPSLTPANPRAPIQPVLQDQLQEGLTILAQMSAKWPEQQAQIALSSPLWKDGLALIDPTWAYFAVNAVGWLDQSASVLVSSGKSLAGQDPMSEYSQLAARLEKLSLEVSQPHQNKGFLDNWHMLRKPSNEPAHARLEKIVQDKAELDQVAGDRMRGLREALEMRDLSRDALAILAHNLPSLRLYIAELGDKNQKEIEAVHTPSSPLSQQKKDRIERQARRALSAIDIVEERLSHEFSSATSNLASLDDAVHQEELMHSRIDGMASKVAAMIAGEGLQKIAVEQSTQALMIAKPRVSSTEMVEVSATKGSFLDRVFLRSAAKSGMTRESARILKEMNQGSSSESLADYFWHNLVKLLEDKGVSPLEKIGHGSLLVETASRVMRDTAGGVVDFPQRLSFFYMMAINHPLGLEALHDLHPSLISAMCRRAIAKRTTEPHTVDRANFDTINRAFILWETRGYECVLNGNERFEVLNSFLSEHMWEEIPPSLQKQVIELVEDGLSLSAPLGLKPQKIEVVHKLASHLSPQLVSYFEYHRLTSEMKTGNGIRYEEGFSRLSPTDANRLAMDIMSSPILRRTGYAGQLVKAQDHLLISTAVPRDYEFDTGSMTPYLTLELSPPENKDVDLSALQVLKQYREHAHSGKRLTVWPTQLTEAAFTKRNITLLHELLAAQPNAKLPADLTISGSQMLEHLIHADVEVGARFGSKVSQTSPEYWCGVLFDSVDANPFEDAKRQREGVSLVKPLNVSMTAQEGVKDPNTNTRDVAPEHIQDLPEIPRKTPLMVACERGATKWMEALDKAGANWEIKDPQGRDAMWYWCTSAWNFSKKQNTPHKSNPYGGSSKLNVPKAKMMYAELIIEQMNAVNHWDLRLASKVGNCKQEILKGILVFHMDQAHQSNKADRQMDIERLLVDMSKLEFQELMSQLVSPTGPFAPGSPEIGNCVELARRSGIIEKEEILDTIDAIENSSKSRTMSSMHQMESASKKELYLKMKLMTEYSKARPRAKI